MGWLVELARQKHRNLTKGGTIAARMWKEGQPLTKEALANNVRALDRGEMVDWWLGERGHDYRRLLADVIGCPEPALREKLEAARPRDDDAGRWFEFEVFPRLRRIDLDEEGPFPGVPPELFAGDGPTGPTWWHAPTGAGRTLVARWLVRRLGWVLPEERAPWQERSFVELSGEPPARRPARVIVASGRPFTRALQDAGWRGVSTPWGWERELIAWVAERIEPGGHFRKSEVEAAFATGRLHAETPGQMLEILAEVDAFGIRVLDRELPAADALRAWVSLHAARLDRPGREATRRHLQEHGADLLPRIELARRVRGLAVTDEAVLTCLPPLPPPPDADTVCELARTGGVEAVRDYARPSAERLVEGMKALRWLLPTGWGFPTRVEGHLRGCVVGLAADGDDLSTLGGALDQPDLAEDVLWALSEPGRLERWLARVPDADATDPETVVALDGIARAVALRVARGGDAPREGLTGLRASLGRIAGSDRRFPDLALRVRLTPDQGWGPLAWLVVDELLGGGPPGERGWALAGAVDRELVLRSDDPEGRAAPLLRRLGVDLLGGLVTAHPDAPAWLTPSVLHGWIRGEVVDESLGWEVARIGPLDVVERLCRPWAPTWEDAAGRLWPAWRKYTGSPLHSTEVEALTRVWSAFPFSVLEHAEATALEKQIPLGVRVQDALWTALLDRCSSGEVLDRAPIPALFTWAERTKFSLGIAAAWRRDPRRAAERLTELLAADPDGRLAPWLRAVPEQENLRVLAATAACVGEHATKPVRDWEDRVIAARATGWRDVWARRVGGPS